MEVCLSPHSDTGTVTLIPARAPPHPSHTLTAHNSHSFLKVLARLTEGHSTSSTSQDSCPENQVSFPCTVQRDSLSLTFSTPSGQALPQQQEPAALTLHNATTSKKGPTVIFRKRSEGSQTTPLKFCTPFSSTTKHNSSALQQPPTDVNTKSNKTAVSKHTPSVTSEAPLLPSQSTLLHKKLLADVQEMSSKELSQLKASLSAVDEVAACLVYSDGTSQLRPTKFHPDKPLKSLLQTNISGSGSDHNEYSKVNYTWLCESPIFVQVKGKVTGAPTVQGLCLAYGAQSGAKEPINYVLMPLTLTDGTPLLGWCRDVLRKLLKSSRVIAYRGQKLVASIMSCLNFTTQSSEWLQWRVFDPLVGEWLLDPDHPPDSFTQVLERCGLQQASSTESTTDDLCADVSLLGPTMVSVYQRLQKENLWSLFERIEIRIIPILAAMEIEGIQVNTAKLLDYAEFLKIKISKVEESAHKAAGHKFSINSTAQLRQVLFEELHLDSLSDKKLSKTQVNKLKSTSEVVLNQLKELHPLPGIVLEYRQLCKMNATNITGTLPYIVRNTLRAAWLHTGTATGRLASINPNIQAFPKQSLNLGVVKESFIVGKKPEEVTIDARETIQSRPGFTFIAADFKSIELRLVAHFSEDELLLSILNSKTTPDVFVHLASAWLGVGVDSVTLSHREQTKRVVYAVVYGVGKERLAEILNVEPSYARDLTNSFLLKFPGVKRFISNTIEECRVKGYLLSICGRRRLFPHIKSDNHQLRLHSERQAVNFVVQGSAADICKCGMIDVCELLSRDHPRSKLLVQIHDELIFEVPDQEIQSITGTLKLSLEQLKFGDCCLKVPLEVRITVGKTWSSLKEL